VVFLNEVTQNQFITLKFEIEPYLRAIWKQSSVIYSIYDVKCTYLSDLFVIKDLKNVLPCFKC